MASRHSPRCATSMPNSTCCLASLRWSATAGAAARTSNMNTADKTRADMTPVCHYTAHCHEEQGTIARCGSHFRRRPLRHILHGEVGIAGLRWALTFLVLPGGESRMTPTEAAALALLGLHNRQLAAAFVRALTGRATAEDQETIRPQET